MLDKQVPIPGTHLKFNLIKNIKVLLYGQQDVKDIYIYRITLGVMIKK